MTTCVVLVVLTVFASAGAVNGQSTAFTYQGQLTDAGVPAAGIYDLQFKLFDDLSAGTQKGGTVLARGAPDRALQENPAADPYACRR